MKKFIKIFILLLAINFLPYAALAQSDVDLSWNASNEVPAHYRGKILPTKNSIVMVSALPFISGDLIFNWFINDKFQLDKSGVNKSDLSFKIDGFPGSDVEIRLEILTADKSVFLNKFITIPVVWPQIFILSGGKALKNLIVESKVEKSLDFTAENYFFNFPKSRLKWNWFIDNKEIADKGGNKPWAAVLNIPSNAALPFFLQIKTAAKSPQNDLESAGSAINLEIK